MEAACLFGETAIDHQHALLIIFQTKKFNLEWHCQLSYVTQQNCRNKPNLAFFKDHRWCDICPQLDVRSSEQNYSAWEEAEHYSKIR